MNAEKSRVFFERLAQKYPDPRTELCYTNPFELLVAVVLSAQSTDKRVNQVTAELFPVANTPQAFVQKGEVWLRQQIRTIGLAPTKAKHLWALSQQLLSKHHGQVPSTRAELEALPGVGRKTASVVLNELFKQTTIAVDTHVFRVARRTGLALGSTTIEVEQDLLRNIATEFQYDAHHWLIQLGRQTCHARRPQCRECLVLDLCANPQIAS